MQRPFGSFPILVALAVAALGPLPAAAQLVPEPSDFLIARVPEAGLQPVIAPWPGGALLAAYPGGPWDASSCARRFAPCSGRPLVGLLLQSPLPPEVLFPIGESLPEPRLFLSPALLPDVDGGFAAVWEDAVYFDVRTGTFAGGDGAGSGIAARIFTAPGVPAGPVFHLNQTVTGDQTSPIATPLTSGRFLVVWESRTRFDAPPRLFARIFRIDGTPAGDELAVAPELPGAQQQAAAAVPVSPDEGFVIAWQGESAGRTVIFTRRFRGPDALPAPPVRVDAGDHGAAAPALATLPDGLALAWRGERAQSGRAFVRVRVLDEAGGPDGPLLEAHPFPLPLSGLAGPPRPDIAADGQGGFLVVWNSRRLPGSTRTAVFATAFEAAGATPFLNRRIDLRRQQNPINPAVVWDGEGAYVVAWQVDHTPPPAASGVQRGRRLVVAEEP